MICNSDAKPPSTQSVVEEAEWIRAACLNHCQVFKSFLGNHDAASMPCRCNDVRSGDLGSGSFLSMKWIALQMTTFDQFKGGPLMMILGAGACVPALLLGRRLEVEHE